MRRPLFLLPLAVISVSVKRKLGAECSPMADLHAGHAPCLQGTTGAVGWAPVAVLTAFFRSHQFLTVAFEHAEVWNWFSPSINIPSLFKEILLSFYMPVKDFISPILQPHHLRCRTYSVLCYVIGDSLSHSHLSSTISVFSTDLYHV